VGKVVRLDLATLSEARSRVPAERTGKDAADLFSAAVVQSGGPGGGRDLVRLGDPAAVRGVDLGAEPVPDETTVCKFRHRLEEHNLGEEILGTVTLHLQPRECGLRRARSWTRPLFTHPVRPKTATIAATTRRCSTCLLVATKLLLVA
jgi:hypothetical protein